MRQVWRKEALADVLNLALGVWLLLTPWIFGFTTNAAASWTAWLSGLAIGVVAVATLVAFAEWEEWINLGLGLWVAGSPWIVGFGDHVTATWVHTIVGIVVAIAAAVRLWFLRQSPPRVTA